MATTISFFRGNRVPTIREIHNLLLVAEDAGREDEAYVFAEEYFWTGDFYGVESSPELIEAEEGSVFEIPYSEMWNKADQLIVCEEIRGRIQAETPARAKAHIQSLMQVEVVPMSGGRY